MPEPQTVEEALSQLEARPDDAELYQRLGNLYFGRRELMEAWRAYMQSLRLDPYDPFTCLYFGNLLAICDDKRYAIELYERAASLAPDLAVVHWCRANLHRKLGEYELAGEAYCRAVTVAPDDVQAQQMLAGWQAFLASGGSGSPLPDV